MTNIIEFPKDKTVGKKIKIQADLNEGLWGYYETTLIFNSQLDKEIFDQWLECHDKILLTEFRRDEENKAKQKRKKEIYNVFFVLAIIICLIQFIRLFT